MDPITVGALATGALGLFGAERANRVNQREARLNRRFQAGEAALNRGFQERMRNTEWQAAVDDMRAAGINPAVAYARGGASSPSGSVAGGAMPAGAENSVSSALAALSMRKQLKLLDAQIAKTQNESRQAYDQAQITKTEADLSTEKWSYYFDPFGKPKGPLRELLDSQHTALVANGARSVSEAQLAQFSVPERKAVAELFSRVGEGGKVLQMLMPLLMNISAGYARGR